MKINRREIYVATQFYFKSISNFQNKFRLHYGARFPVQPDSSGSVAADDHLCDTWNFCTEPVQEDRIYTELYRDSRGTTYHCV